MPAWAVYAMFTAGGVALGAVGLWLLYRAGWNGGVASEQAKTSTATAAVERARSEVLQKEVTKDDVIKSLEDGSF